jgi:hypothetical protein
MTKSSNDGKRSEYFIQNFYLPLAVFLIAFLMYWRTLAPTIYWGDGIEFCATTKVLGVAHPTGYPLLLMLGKLFSLLPLGTFAYRLNFMCAVFSALGILLFYFLLIRVFSVLPSFCFSSATYRATIASGGALGLAFTKGIWLQATAMEAYAVNFAFLVAVLFVFTSYILDRKPGLLYLLFFLFGLGLANHFLILTTTPALVAALITALRSQPAQTSPGITTVTPERNVPSRRLSVISASLLLLLLGASAYLYLPIRARAKPPLNWGNPENLKNLLWVINGGEFKKYHLLQEKPGKRFTLESYHEFVEDQTIAYGKWMINQWVTVQAYMLKLRCSLLIIMSALIGVGFFWGLRLHLLLYVIFGLVFGAHLGVIYTYNIPDISAYFAPTAPLLMLFGLSGLVLLQSAAEKKLWHRKINYLHLCYFLLPIIAVHFNFQWSDKSHYTVPEDYGRAVLEALAPHALILTGTDNDIYPLWYLQQVEHEREDVVVVGSNFIFSDWYREYFRHVDLHGISLTIRHQEPTTDLAFFSRLSEWIIDPNLSKVPIYTLVVHPYLERYNPQFVGVYISPSDYRAALERFLPQPVLYRLRAGPEHPEPSKDRL